MSNQLSDPALDVDKEKAIEETPIRVLIDLYKTSDSNHKFFVGKRFTILTLYLPLLSGALLIPYLAIDDFAVRLLVGILGIAATAFLYVIEYRNWLMSNVCLDDCVRLEREISNKALLFQKLRSAKGTDLPVTKTHLDSFLSRFVISQHNATAAATYFLLGFWLLLTIAAGGIVTPRTTPPVTPSVTPTVSTPAVQATPTRP